MRSVKKILYLGLLPYSMLVHGLAHADDKPDSNEPVPQEVRACTMCHGFQGRHSGSTVPNLAGLQADYLAAELKAFRNNTRHNEVAKEFMWEASGGLSDAEIAVAANYFSRQTPVYGVASDPELTREGKLYYEKGIPKKGVVSCMGCHGVQGGGSIAPRLAGQPAGYIYDQLRAVQKGTRPHATMMRNIVKSLSPDEITALARYIESLNPPPTQDPAAPLARQPLPAPRVFSAWVEWFFDNPDAKPWDTFCNASATTGKMLQLRREASVAAVRSCFADGHECYSADVTFSYGPGRHQNHYNTQVYFSCYVIGSVSG